MIKRIAAAVGVVVFLVAAGTSLSYAYWSASAGMTTTVRSADPALTNCSNVVALKNGSFETVTPALADNSWSQASTISDWTSTVPGASTARASEVWRGSVVSPILPAGGAQNIELNSTDPTPLYQQVATTPGQVLRWGFWHRGRDSATTGDQVKLTIGAGGTNATTSTTTSTSPTLAQIFTANNTAWVYRSGTYTVPAGQTTTRLSLTSISTGGGNASQGNLIDDVSLGTGPCITATSGATNVTGGSDANYRVGDTVQFVTTIANGGGAASASTVAKIVLPAHLVLVPGSIAVGTTAATAATGDDLAEYVSGTRTIVARVGVGAGTTTGGRVSNGAPVTVTYRAVVQLAAVTDGIITHTPTVEFVDEAISTWTLSVTGTQLTKVVQPAADLAVVVLSQPNITASGAATWSFRITNNGPSAATGVSIALALTNGPSYGTPTFTTTNAGAGTSNCTATGTNRTCAIGAIPAGEGRTVTVTATLPANPTSLYPVTATATSTSYDHVSGNNSATSTGLDGIAPTSPTGVAATGAPLGSASSGSVTVSWTAATDSLGTIAGYRIYVDNGTTAVTTAAASATSATVSGLTANTAYWFRVTAFDAAGNESTLAAPSSSNGAGAMPYVSASDVYLRPVSAPAVCIATRSTGSTTTVAVRTSCSGSTDWRLVDVGVANTINLLLNNSTSARMTAVNNTAPTSNSASVGSTVSTNATTRWKLDVFWDGSQARLRLKTTATTGDLSGQCLTTNGTGDNSNVILSTCSDTLATQRFTLGN